MELKELRSGAIRTFVLLEKYYVVVVVSHIYINSDHCSILVY